MTIARIWQLGDVVRWVKRERVDATIIGFYVQEIMEDFFVPGRCGDRLEDNPTDVKLSISYTGLDGKEHVTSKIVPIKDIH